MNYFHTEQTHYTDPPTLKSLEIIPKSIETEVESSWTEIILLTFFKKYICKKLIPIFAYKYIQAICLVSDMKKYFGDKMTV